MFESFYEWLLPFVLPYDTSLTFAGVILFAVGIFFGKLRVSYVKPYRIKWHVMSKEELKNDEAALSKKMWLFIVVLIGALFVVFIDIVSTYGSWRVSDKSNPLVCSLVIVPAVLILIVTFIFRWVYFYKQSKTIPK